MFEEEETQDLINLEIFAEKPIKKERKRYKIIPVSDPENSFASFDFVLEEDYEEMEKLKEQSLQKTIKKK